MRTLATTLALAGLALPALADSPRVPLLPAYVQECGSCHVAFAPSLLPAASWQRLMDGLARHYGTDASLDPQATRALSTWLAAHAGGKRAAEAPRDDRITQGGWFQREHREVRTRFGTPAVRSAADCGACHTQAAAGSYREREIRLPG